MTHRSTEHCSKDERSPGDMAEASGPPGLTVDHGTGLALGRQPSRTVAEIAPPPDGAWIDKWISPQRLSPYLHATTGDRAKALALYEWNAQLSASLQRDLAHFEVALRNAYDSAASGWRGSGHWLVDGYKSLFGPVIRMKRQQVGGRSTKRPVDINEKPRVLIETAIKNAGGPNAIPGKVVAELSFGFWRYLSSSAHEKSLWVPLLHRAFPPGTGRTDVDGRIGRLYELRNRVAHHEPLLRENLSAKMEDLLIVARLLHPELGAYIEQTSTVLALTSVRP